MFLNDLNLGRNLIASIGSVLVATTFMAAATGPALTSWIA